MYPVLVLTLQATKYHSPSQGRSRARRELALAAAAVNAAAAASKETSVKAAVPTPPPSKDVVDAAVKAVVKTFDKAVQAGLLHHKEQQPSQGVLFLAE